MQCTLEIAMLRNKAPFAQLVSWRVMFIFRRIRGGYWGYCIDNSLKGGVENYVLLLTGESSNFEVMSEQLWIVKLD